VVEVASVVDVVAVTQEAVEVVADVERSQHINVKV
jgi:hypothetical protein